jgi:hypothetical protein
VIAEALLVALGLGGSQACTSVKAVTERTGRLDQVRLGFGLDRQGRVTSGCAASTFAVRDPIHLSMQVTDASAGSVVSVAVRDVATQRIAWSESRPVPAGRSHQTFEIGREIAQGRYLAESTFGGHVTTPWPFVVHDKRQGVR